MTVRSAWVYVMQREDGIRKLGWTVDLRRRRSSLKSTYGPMKVEKTWEMSELAAISVESLVHGNLASVRFTDGGALELYDLSLRRLTIEVNKAKAWVMEDTLCDDLMKLDWSDEWKRERAQRIERQLREEQEKARIHAEAFAKLQSAQSKRFAIIETEEVRLGRKMSRAEITAFMASRETQAPEAGKEVE